MSNPNPSPNQPNERPPAQPSIPLIGGGELVPTASHTPRALVQHRHGPPTVPASAPNAIAFLKALRRRWLLAFTLGILVGGAAAAGVWVFLPPGKHTAYAKLLMPKKPDAVLYEHLEATSDFASFQQTQVALIKSRLVLNTALRNPKVLDLNLDAVKNSISPVEWLEKEVRVTFPDGPELPRITLSGDNPEQLKVLVQAIVDAYMHEIVNAQTKRRMERLDQLKEVSTKYKERLGRLVSAKNELAKAIGSGDNKVIALKQEMAQKQLSLAEAELIKVESDLRRLELEAKSYKTTSTEPGEVPDKLVEAYLDKALEKDLEYRARLEAQLDDFRRVLDNEQHPKIRALVQAIADKKKAIETRRKELRPQYKAELQEKGQYNSQDRLVQMDEQIKFNKEFRNLLQVEIGRLQKDSQNLNVKSLDLDGYRIDIALAEAGVTRVLTEIDKATVELPNPPRVSRLEDVVVAAPNEASRKLMMASLGGGGGFFAVLFLVSMVEFRSRRLDSFDEVGQGLGLQLMGTLPAAPHRFARGAIRSAASSAAEWQSLLVESINSVRTLVMHAVREHPMRVLMVASATSGEGKTSLATHLAASLARAGHKTLLLDGDLRKPSAHRVFDMVLGPGFCEILRGEVEGLETARPTAVDGLWLISAGVCDNSAIELLARDGVASLLEQLKTAYDFIVIDSSPVLPVADSLLLAQHADGILFSLFHEVSRLPLVYAAYQKLSMVGVPMLGAVINGTHEDTYGYGHYYAGSGRNAPSSSKEVP